MITWRAVYTDNSVVASGPQQYDKLDRTRIKQFQLVDNDKVLVNLAVYPRRQVFYRRRVARRLLPNAGNEVCHIIGWREKQGARTIQRIFFVKETADKPQIQARTSFDESDAWFYSPKFREDEELKEVTGPERMTQKFRRIK